MQALSIKVCRSDDAGICATRLVPGFCTRTRAEDWVAARPDLVLASQTCVDPLAAVAPLAVTEVARGIFAHKGRHEMPGPANQGDEANAGFILGEKGVAVFDTGGSRATGEALYASVRAETDLPIDWLILTHMHPDHVMGASVFREAGARVIGHARLPDALLNRADTYAQALARALGPEAAIGSDIVLPDATVEDRMEIDLGNRVLLLEAHPTAHTDNDLTIWDAGTGTWILGDLVFAERIPSMDGSVLGWLEALDALSRREAARIVPGHGPVSLPWPAGAAPMRGYLEALVAETRAALARGESLSAASRTLGRGLKGNWRLFDEFNARNATAVYRELEWE